MRISVLSSPGRHGEEDPFAFHVGAHRLQVAAIVDRWRDAAHRYFDLSVVDGRRFILRYDPAARSWELSAVYAAAAPARPAARAAAPPPQPALSGSSPSRPATK